MFELIDTRTRGLLALAQAIGAEEGAEALGPEHLVAALFSDGRGAAERSSATRVLAGKVASWEAAVLVGQAIRGLRPVRPLSSPETTALQACRIELDSLAPLQPSVAPRAQGLLARPTRWWRRGTPAPRPDDLQDRPRGNLPLSEGSKHVLEAMLREALQLGDDYLGSEHLLLGLLRCDDPRATTALGIFGVDLDGTRAAVAAIRRGPDDGPHTPS